MPFQETPHFAKRFNWSHHSNPESVPICKKMFEKVHVRPAVNSAWEIINNSAPGDKSDAFKTINKYAETNAKMLAGRTVQEMCDMVILENKSQEEAIEYGAAAFRDYKPLNWQAEKDAAQAVICAEELHSVFKNALEGLSEAQAALGLNRLTGEADILADWKGLQLRYNGKPDYSKRVELKTVWSSVADTKSGKRAGVVPNTPTHSHLSQVTGYWVITNRLSQCIVQTSATKTNVHTAENCEKLEDEAMHIRAQSITARCKIRENLLRTAETKEQLFELIEPDFSHMYAWNIAPEALFEAKQLFGFTI